jgi:hypothetical protein
MLVSFVFPRVGAWRFGSHTILPLALAACSDGDLFIPDDRAPVQLTAISGDGQSAVAGSTVPHPLVVKALDRAGRPVEGAVILFQFVDRPDGAAIAPSAPETDPDGLASVEVTLGRPAGDQPVDALLDAPERDVSVRFLLTAIPSNGGGGAGDDDDDPPPEGGGGGGSGGDDTGGNGGDGGDGDGDHDDGDDDDGDDDDEEGGGGKGKGKGKGGKGNGDD